MRFDIITLFPELFLPFFRCGVVGRAFSGGLARAETAQLRDYCEGAHGADDRPFGGGSGMVLAAAPVLAAVRDMRKRNAGPVIYPTPRGEVFSDAVARDLAKLPGCIILCGRYRGVDERALEAEADREISLGDYVLSGGETAAMAVMDAVLRYVPGVLGNPLSAEEDSFGGGLLDAPCYTRPEVVEGRAAPAVLLSGDHAAIREWRQARAREMTAERRPDLLSPPQPPPSKMEGG